MLTYDDAPEIYKEASPITHFTKATGPTIFLTGDLDNPESEVSKMIANKNGVRLLDQLGNKPQVYYLTGVGGAVPSNRAIKKS